MKCTMYEGEEQGCNLLYQYENNTYYITVTCGEKSETESFKRQGYEPRAGIDVADSALADEIADKLILKLKP